MHELGVVFHVIEILEELTIEQELTQVKSVTLQLGEVSTVIPSYLMPCWRWAADKRDWLKGAELLVETLPAITYCEDCEKEYGTVEHGRTCPHCGSENTYLIQGQEFMIKEIEAG